MELYTQNIVRDALAARYAPMPSERIAVLPSTVTKIADGKIALLDKLATAYLIETRENITNSSLRGSSYLGSALIHSRSNPKCYVASPNSAAIMDTPTESVNVLTIRDILVNVLGYTDTEILEVLKNFNQKNVDFTLIGYGGVGINVTYIWNELAKMYGFMGLFKSYTIYEGDELNYTNIPRLLVDVSTMRVKKSDLNTNKALNKLKLLKPSEYIFLADDLKLVPERFTASHIKPNVVHYGAPDFETRALMENSNFIFAGHGGDSCVLYYQPVIDETMARESYGSIDLNSFFINIVKLAIESLKHIGNEYPKDTELFIFNAKEDADVASKVLFY